MTTSAAVRQRWQRMWRSYERGADEAGNERPLVGYGVLLGTYSALTGLAALAVRRRARRDGALPTSTVGDLALLSVATFRVSRTLAKDSVTAVLRAPFATYQGPAGPGEVMEAPRPGPVRHAVGELVTCPFCLGQWVGTAALAGLALAPRTTRWLAGGMTVVAASDALQHAYAALQKGR